MDVTLTALDEPKEPQQQMRLRPVRRPPGRTGPGRLVVRTVPRRTARIRR